jgi:ribosomal protein S12 methylthiotransferase RimO
VSARRTVSIVTLGCARNEVDSEELAGRLDASGWELVSSETAADVTLVNTCGFIDAAKQDSIDTLLGAADGGGKVVAVGCLAQRYGNQLADALPEATVLSFDDYAVIGERLDDVLEGRPLVPHSPTDRRTLLPISPVERAAVAQTDPSVGIPGHAGGPGAGAVAQLLRRRLDGGPAAPLKLASGCDRRCAFCAIPSFRGAFVSRPAADVIAEARWLAEQGVRELVLVSENSTSYGKDLGDLRLLERLLPELAGIDGIARVRLSYLQPAEMRPSLVEVMTTTPGVVPYFDLSFQHASGPLLRRMRRFGRTESFLELLGQVRERTPDAGARSNVIVGFPGESEDDVAELERFLTQARLDVVGVFGYSDEDGTEAASLDGKLDAELVAERVERISSLVEELTAQRAEERIGSQTEVLVEGRDPEGRIEGRADHQAPEVDGSTLLIDGDGCHAGDLVQAIVVGTEGVDLVAELVS